MLRVCPAAVLEARGDTWGDTQSRESSSAKLSQHCHSLIGTKTDAAGESAAPALLRQTDGPLAVSTLTTYLLPFHRVSSNVPTVLTRKGSTAGRPQGQDRKEVRVSCAASSLLHLLDRTVRSSCAGSCSGRCVGRTGPRSRTRRSQRSLARIGSRCSLMQTHKQCGNHLPFRKLIIKQQVVFLLHFLLSCVTESRD